MNTTKFIELLSYTIPAIITGVVAYLFFKTHAKNEHARRAYELKKERQNQALPTRLQAYERMTLFLERITPNRLLVRVKPVSDDKVLYQQQLVNAIETELEHNLAQQVYLSNECWNTIITAKNSIINSIRTATANTSVENSSKLQEHLLQETVNKEPATKAALVYIKEEVKHIF